MIFTEKPIQEKLKSFDQRIVAIGLSDIFLDQLDNPLVREKLEKIRDIIWADPEPNPRPNNFDFDRQRSNKDKDRIQTLLQDVPEESKKALAEAYVRLGHLYEIAGHAARENFFYDRKEALAKFMEAHPHQEPPQNILVPGGVNELLLYNKDFQTKTLDQMVTLLSTPVSEYVFTQHPTNTNTPQAMALQRAISHELETITHSKKNVSLAALKTTVEKFAHEPLVQDKNFTAYDETNIVINFLTNAYHDVDRFYESTERGLERKFGKEAYDKKRWELDLKQRFSSWGSAGDKDGNNNIKCENTLEAIILHKKKAAELLAESIDGIGALAGWKDRFLKAKEAYGALEARIEEVRDGGNDIALTNNQFNDLSHEAQTISRELGKVKDFLGDIEVAGKNKKATDAEQKQLLAIHRKVRIFGFNLGKIEYRETAEEYERVVKMLVKYAKKHNPILDAAFSHQRNPVEALTEILRNPETASEWAKMTSAFMQELKGEELRKYVKSDDKNATPDEMKQGDKTIAYHTLRRMELARDFDDMITHNVLAECKGTQNLIEALALQVAVTQDVGHHKTKRAMMNIVPLFEEAETMKEIPKVLKQGLANEVYLGHLEALQKKEHTPNIVQQIQIAHSDNARRAGAIGSRGIIHTGHYKADETIVEYNKDPKHSKVDLQFYEGGSQSDSYRNGVRAVTAAIKDFGMAKFAKMTFQGGDLLNYFNQSSSTERLMLRSLVEQAKLLNSASYGHHHQTALETETAGALSALQSQYDVNYYDKPSNPIGKLLHALDYREQIIAGSAGTRGNRKNDDFSHESVTGVDPKAVRTIGFSEDFQHGGQHPSVMGTDSLEYNLGACLRNIAKELPEGSFNHVGALTASGLKSLYKDSPTFRDSIDKMCYSLINTRVYPLTNKLERYQLSLMPPKMVDGKPVQIMDSVLRDSTLDKAYNDLMPEYKDMADMVYKTFTGQEISNDLRRSITQGVTRVQALDRSIALLKSIPELQHFEAHNYKHHFLDGLDTIEHWAGLDNSRLTHNGRDTVYHGRTFLADDPNYRQAYMINKRDQQRGAAVA